MTKAKNILLIGPTESGKSTLGNVLINRNDNFEKVFKENGRTEKTKIEEVKIEETNYRIIDTVSWDWDGDTSPQQILTELAQVFQAAERKIDRILLLMKGRDDWVHVVTAFKSLKNLDSELLKYITIVYSNFVGFEEQNECDENDRRLKEITDQKIVEVVKHLTFIYVNNSRINTSFSQREGETEEDFQIRKEEQERNKERRKSSRRIVLDHLKAKCQETYHVDREKIANFLNANPESSEAKTEKTTVTETRNILLIGVTGSGKSTLANVLVNRNGNFSEIFESSSSSVSTTEDTQVEEVKIGEVNYRIIDTVGLGDNRMGIPEVAKKLTEGFQSAGGEINRIFLVVKGRFNKEDYEVFYLLRELLNVEPSKYLTIIKTGYEDFKNKKSCEEDINTLKNEAEPRLVEIINSAHVVHVDNQPFSNGEVEENKREEIKKIVEEIRESSRQKIIEHLETCQSAYQLEDMGNLEEKIRNFLMASDEERKRKNQETIADFKGDMSSGKVANDLTEKTKQEIREKQKELEERRERMRQEREEEQEEIKNLERKLAKLKELGKGNKKKGSGGILFFVIIIVVIGIIGCLWPTKKEKKT